MLSKLFYLQIKYTKTSVEMYLSQPKYYRLTDQQETILLFYTVVCEST